MHTRLARQLILERPADRAAVGLDNIRREYPNGIRHWHPCGHRLAAQPVPLLTRLSSVDRAPGFGSRGGRAD
jgi:hypothetical protein